jgi:DNA-binding CsgD family transcriptional regulator/tetratricopeptide (TPR) repeat protein
MIAAMPRVTSPIFVGRAAELTQLRHALWLAAAGRPSTRLVAGDAGIGKTRLIAEFVAAARGSGAQVLTGDCLPLGDSGLPYAPFVGALRPLLRTLPPDHLDEILGPGRSELASLLPDLDPAPVQGTRRRSPRTDAGVAQARMFEIILGLFRRLADERCLVLVLEDLHWADASTRDLLRFLVRNARDTRILFIGTYRSDELHRRHPLRPLLAELQRLEGVDDVELRAFGSEDVADLLEGITGEVPDSELVSAVLGRSGGNPFFVEELMAAGEAGLALPRSLRDTIGDRVRQLGQDGQHLLRVASVAGPSVDHRTLADVAELAAAALTEAIRECVECHLLVPTTPDEMPGYQFRHALVQEVVYDELLPTERTQLHAAYARAIEQRTAGSPRARAGSTAQLAHHWLMAHDLERALPASLAAARAAAGAAAYSEAQAFLERCLELWPKVDPNALPSDVDRTVILEESAEAAVQAGDARRAIDYIRAALREPEVAGNPMRGGVLHHRVAWYLNESGDWQAGVAAMERAIELIPMEPPTPERAEVLSDLAHSMMIRGRYTESMALAEAALAISRAVAAPTAEARALNALGLDLAGRSDVERSLPILREGYRISLEIGDPQAIFLSGVGLGWALDEAAEHEESLDVALSTRERLHALGADPRFGGQLASKAGRALYELGRWDEAERLLDETIASDPNYYAMRWLLSNRVRLGIHRGRFDAVRRDIQTYEALGERVVGPDPDLMRWRAAELALVTGNPRTARRLVADTLDSIVEPELDTDARVLLVTGLRAEADEADAARSAGDASREAEAVRRADELLGAMRHQMLRVSEIAARPARTFTADLAQAEALAARARGDATVEQWEAALAMRRAVGRPFEIATALADLAVALVPARRREEAGSAIAEAHAIAAGLDARPLREALESIARRARIGLEGVDTAEDAADRLGLTPREREVLRLLADGRTNRQIGDQLFMAESTAGVHVSRILGKLGVTRRSEAAVAAHRLGLSRLS